jgi:hypothetical protein
MCISQYGGSVTVTGVADADDRHRLTDGDEEFA